MSAKERYQQSRAELCARKDASLRGGTPSNIALAEKIRKGGGIRAREFVRVEHG